MSAAARGRGRLLLVVGVVLMAATLRIAVASLSPVIDRIEAEFVIPAAIVGLIGMAPPAAFAVAGMLTPPLERRIGLERLSLLAIIVAAVALAGRALVGDAWSLLIVTGVLFAAVGVGNVLLPGVVKKHFPGSVGVMTAIYTTAMAVATTVPPLVAVPLADSYGWRASFTVWAAVAAASFVPWVVIAMRERASRIDPLDEPRPVVLGRLVRLPMAWALVVSFAASSSVAYSSFAWLPVILVEAAGATPEQAGALLALFSAIGLPSSLVIPLLVARYRVVGVIYAVSLGAGIAGIAGLMIAPASAAVLWVVLLGVTPALFPMLLVLVGLRTRSHDTAVALSGFMQSLGYAVAALVPLGFGIAHEVTGSWTVSLVILAVVVVATVPAGVVVTRGRTIEAEWERRHGAW